jgi:HD superfamily phosphohydrolase
MMNKQKEPKKKIISDYHKILSPDFPDFLHPYINLPIMQRLAGIGLLCGSDYTSLFKNRFFYSRLDHSIGVALIIWHFTKNKAQTLSGLFHDISTPTFSHVSDFRKGDALTQTITEISTSAFIRKNEELLDLLKKDGLTPEDIEDYHKYPIADNEIPSLSADRLEYMFPSGMALENSWTLQDIQEIYNDIEILTNEEEKPELGFATEELALKYCKKFCITGHLLQLNEDKLTLHLLGEIMNLAEELNILSESDFYRLSEKEAISKIQEKTQEINYKDSKLVYFYRLFNTFLSMKEILHVENLEDLPEPAENYFIVDIKVKQRYINPLVKTPEGTKRIYNVNPLAKKIIDDFISYKDTKYGCVKLK